MIGRLVGTVVSEAGDGTLVLDVGGVGYELVAPLGTLGRVPRDHDARVTLLVHTHVREDAIVLFGFADEYERTAFRLLTAVAGVGPKIAVGILGVLPAAELAQAVARGDVRRFQSVPGVGKKIAERLALELKDKLAAGALAGATNLSMPASPAATSSAAARAGQPFGQLVETLARMGFKPAQVDRAMAELKDREGAPIDELVREALKILT